MIRKFGVLLAFALALSLLAGLLGALFTGLRAGGAAQRVAEEEAWSLGEVAVRGDEDYRRAADGFRSRYRWLVPKEPEPEPEPETAEDADAGAVPSGPAWLFVGVLLEDSVQERYALVAESGQVNRYRVGDAFGDGTRLLAIDTQFLRVQQDGVERDVFLYLRN